jgi:hypothetical protein
MAGTIIDKLMIGKHTIGKGTTLVVPIVVPLYLGL